MPFKYSFTLILAIILSLLVSSCGPGQALGPTVTPSPSATITPIPTSTYTPTPVPTVTATVIPDGTFIEWDRLELEVGGRPMEFVIGTEKGADISNKWGMTSMEINGNLVDAETKLSTMISASFWQVYEIQSGNEVAVEEFLNHPEKYKITLVSPIGEDGYKSTLISLDQIKRFERRYVNITDDRSYFEDKMNTIYSCSTGYELTDDGSFIVYESFNVPSKSIDGWVINGLSLSKEKDFPFYSFSEMVGKYLLIEIFNIAYTPELLSNDGLKNHEGEFLTKFFPNIKKFSDVPDLQKVEVVNGKFVKGALENYFSKNGFWKISLADGY